MHATQSQEQQLGGQCRPYLAKAGRAGLVLALEASLRAQTRMYLSCDALASRMRPSAPQPYESRPRADSFASY